MKLRQPLQNFNEEDGTIELTIENLKPEDAGKYSVKAINKLGEATQEAEIRVFEPKEKPKFILTLTPVSSGEGSPAKFSVKASGNPKPEIKW